MKRITKTKRGDSIIEVLLAIAIFSAVAVSSLATMNRGLANIETALEETVARSEIDAQADLIRYVRSGYQSTPTAYVLNQTGVGGSPDVQVTYKKMWDDIIASVGGDTKINSSCTSNTPNGFVLRNTDYGISYQKITSYSSSGGIPKAKEGNSNDLWVTAVGGGGSGGTSAYYDFYINTCWYTPGSSVGTTLYTTIRLTNPDYNNA